MGKSVKNTLDNAIKWHEKNCAFDLNDKREIARPALSASRYDRNVKALVSANGFSLFVTWGDFSAAADANGWIAHKKSAAVADLAHAKFPDWLSIIPRSFDYELSFTVGQMVQAVKLAHIFSRDSNDSTRFVLCPTDGLIAVTGKSSEHGDCLSHVNARSRVHAEVSQMPLVIALNASSVLDALSGFADSDEIYVYANATAAAQPIMIGVESQRIAVIMTMSMSTAYQQNAPDVQTKALTDVLDRIDYHAPRAYSPVKSFKKPAAKVSKEARAAQKARQEREAASAAQVRDIDAPFVRGSWIPAEVTHDPQKGALADVLARERYGMFYGRVDPQIVVRGNRRGLQVIAYREASDPLDCYYELLTLTVTDGCTTYAQERRYRHQSSLNRTGKSGTLPFRLNATTFLEVLRDYIPDGCRIVKVSTEPAQRMSLAMAA